MKDRILEWFDQHLAIPLAYVFPQICFVYFVTGDEEESGRLAVKAGLAHLSFISLVILITGGLITSWSQVVLWASSVLLVIAIGWLKFEGDLPNHSFVSFNKKFHWIEILITILVPTYGFVVLFRHRVWGRDKDASVFTVAELCLGLHLVLGGIYVQSHSWVNQYLELWILLAMVHAVAYVLFLLEKSTARRSYY